MQGKTRDVLGARDSLPAGQMQIGEVAELTGLTQRTIRYYEELGLLPAPGRTSGDFRLYTPQDVRRISRIARLKELLGFSLAEIKEIVVADEAMQELKCEVHYAGDAEQRLEKLREFERFAVAQLAVLDRKLAQMEEMRAGLEARLEHFRDEIGAIEESGVVSGAKS